MVTVVSLDSVEPVELPGGSWSRMLVTADRVGVNGASLGYSVFAPGSETPTVSHEVEEVAYVVSGQGELRLEDGAVRFATGDALHIPARTQHAVVNDSPGDVVMVFGFPHPDYPPTERKQ